MTERRLLTVILVDGDINLPVENSLVFKFDDVLTEETDQVTIQQLMVDEDIKTILEAHNKVRVKVVNKTILERTGSKVNLLPVTIKDLCWKIK